MGNGKGCCATRRSVSALCTSLCTHVIFLDALQCTGVDLEVFLWYGNLVYVQALEVLDVDVIPTYVVQLQRHFREWYGLVFPAFRYFRNWGKRREGGDQIGLCRGFILVNIVHLDSVRPYFWFPLSHQRPDSHVARWSCRTYEPS